MKPTVEQLENLLALKRYERPEDGYWQDFLCEFHQGQRERSVKKSGLTCIQSKISAWFSEMGSSKWAYGAGLAYAAFAVMALLPNHGDKRTSPAMTPVNYQVIPAPSTTPAVEQLDELDLSPATQGNSGEQVF